MITKEQIQKLVEEKIAGTDHYIVEITIGAGNQIIVNIDGFHGISIDECVQMSRHIESAINRDAEDFELEVSSAGIGRPFKVLKQYEKCIGKNIEIITNDGLKTKAQLLTVNSSGIEVQIPKKKTSKSAKNTEGDEKHFIEFQNIKSTVEAIDFKQIKNTTT